MVTVSYERGVTMGAKGHKRMDLARIKVGRAPTIDEIRTALAGHDLACWCPLTCPDGSPHPCHADVLLEIANAPLACEAVNG